MNVQNDSYEAKYHQLLKSYKAYDKRRKEYYASKMKELGELQSVIQEIEDVSNIPNIAQKINDLRVHNNKLTSRLSAVNKELDAARKLIDPEIISIYTKSTKDVALLSRIAELERAIDNYKVKLEKANNLAYKYLQTLIKLQNGSNTEKVNNGRS